MVQPSAIAGCGVLGNRNDVFAASQGEAVVSRQPKIKFLGSYRELSGRKFIDDFQRFVRRSGIDDDQLKRQVGLLLVNLSQGRTKPSARILGENHDRDVWCQTHEFRRSLALASVPTCTSAGEFPGLYLEPT